MQMQNSFACNLHTPRQMVGFKLMDVFYNKCIAKLIGNLSNILILVFIFIISIIKLFDLFNIEHMVFVFLCRL